MSVEAILMYFETMFACEIRLIVQAFHVVVCTRVSNAVPLNTKRIIHFAKGTFLSRKEDFLYERELVFQILGPTGSNWTQNSLKCFLKMHNITI